MRPISIAPADLIALESSLTAVESSLGTRDAAVRGSIASLARTTGALPAEQMLRRGLTGDEFKRPWRWLAAAARAAEVAGEDALAARCFLFSSFWTVSLEPHLTLADHLDLMMDPAPADARAGIATAALGALARITDDAELAPAIRIPMPTTPQWRMLAAKEIVDMQPRTHVDADVVAQAREVLSHVA